MGIYKRGLFVWLGDENEGYQNKGKHDSSAKLLTCVEWVTADYGDSSLIIVTFWALY